MPHRRKHVHVTTFGPLPFGDEHTVGWEDVYLSLYVGKRRRLKLAPTYISREELRSEIALQESCAKGKLTDYFNSEAARLTAILSQLDEWGDVVIDVQPKPGRDPGKDYALATVYTPRAWINKTEADRMSDVYLAKIGVHRARYKWQWPKYCVTPVTIPVAE